MKWHGGKGSDKRKGADDAKYRDNWDRIFGKRDSSNTQRDSDKGRSNKST
jgi:hypothetical protein